MDLSKYSSFSGLVYIFFIFPLWEGQHSLPYILCSAHVACVPKCPDLSHCFSCCCSSHILLFSSHRLLLRSVESICSLSPFQILDQPHYIFLYVLVFCRCHVFGFCIVTVSSVSFAALLQFLITSFHISVISTLSQHHLYKQSSQTSCYVQFLQFYFACLTLPVLILYQTEPKTAISEVSFKLSHSLTLHFTCLTVAPPSPYKY